MKKMLPNLIFRPFYLVVILSLFTINSCKKDSPEVASSRLTKDFNSESILQWNNLFLEIERYAQGFRPCPAPRAMAYIGLACYEACVIDMPTYKSLRFNYPGLNLPTHEPLVDYHYPTVVNAIYSKLLTNFLGNVNGIPTEKFAKITALYNKLKKYDN